MGFFMKRIRLEKTKSNIIVDSQLSGVTAVVDDRWVKVKLPLYYTSAYGFGEKYDFVNQKGQIVDVLIKEKCFNQGAYTYFTFPFLMTVDGFGIYVKTELFVEFDLRNDNEIIITFLGDVTDTYPEIIIYEGSPKEIIGQFKKDTINTKVFPKWVLGAWMSSNRWEKDEHIYEQLDEMKNSKIPHNVMVIERWSDLTTFYNWWGSESSLINGDEYHTYGGFLFDKGLFKNPKKLFEDIHKENLHVILWDLPVFATSRSVEGLDPTQRYKDNEYVIEKKLCMLKKDGTPYIIPDGNWFAGSMIPDFTKEECNSYWFNHRKHLFEIGVDGFKCDGGEFIYGSDVYDSNGKCGHELVNHYAARYIEAYTKAMNENQVVFARSGDEFTPGYALTWAGDQLTTWPELKHIITCLLSASLSGINYWGFDITGFSGQLPTVALYKRGIQLAAFVPLMQWHSDPVCNGGWDNSLAWKINDRSPWNIARFHKSESLLDSVSRYFNLHYSLIPHMYNLSLQANVNGVPTLRHLVYEYPLDLICRDIDDEFMVGDSLLVCPFYEDYIDSKRVYLPSGVWYDLYTGDKYEGNKYYMLENNEDIIPVFVKENSIIPLNLPESMILGDAMDNDLSKYTNLTFVYTGNSKIEFNDDFGNEIEVEINNGEINVIKNTKELEIKFVELNKLNKIWE